MKNYIKWVMNGEFTPTGELFDIGRTCLKAIRKYDEGKTSAIECGSTSIESNGNGSLMRILPVALYSYYKNLDESSIIKLTNEMSSLTHGHDISKLGCYIYVRYIMFLIDGFTKEENYFKLNETVNSLAESKKKIIIKSLDTAKASIQCFLESYDYEDAIRNAISIGGDSDTIAAITGGMAASYYGIPNDIYTTGLLYLDDYLRNIYDEYLKQTNLKWE